jgi:hypothetical protein
MRRQRKNAILNDWYAIVLRKKPDCVLAIDRTLCQAQTAARVYYPDIDSKELAFRTISQDEYLQIIRGAVAPERSDTNMLDPEYEI